MSKISFNLNSEADTLAFGERLAKLCVPLCKKQKRCILVNLVGDLGAGKTTLTRGFIKAQGYLDIVRSPTYTLVEPYDFQDFSVYHFDLYRLLDPEELEYMGIRDYFEKVCVCLVEWPDKAGELLPLPDLTVNLAYKEMQREVVVESSILNLSELETLLD